MDYYNQEPTPAALVTRSQMFQLAQQGDVNLDGESLSNFTKRGCCTVIESSSRCWGISLPHPARNFGMFELVELGGALSI